MKVKLNCVTLPLVEGENKMRPEEYVIHSARVSSPDNRLNHETAPKLLKYLIDNQHWSPLEMISLGFEIETSRAIAQQMIRHRSFSFQEVSQRYSKVENIEPVELRLQADSNRQSSSEVLLEDNKLYELVKVAHDKAFMAYETLLANGVARECARMVLPLATQTNIVMHGTLRSWIHFLDQRCSDHAQKEIRIIALEIRKLLSEECPWTASALGWSNELTG